MFINDPTRLARLRARLELQRSLGRRQGIKALDNVEDMGKEISGLGNKLPEALVLFNNGHTAKQALTKEFISAILISVSRKVTKKSLSKQDLIDVLEENVKLQPRKMTKQLKPTVQVPMICLSKIRRLH